MARNWHNTPHELADCGVRRINVSLDTLDPDKFQAHHPLGRACQGAGRHRRRARRPGLKIKINAVALKDFNEHEIPDIMRWAHGRGMDMTVIETMPMGEIDEDRTDQYLPLSQLRARSRTAVHPDRHPLQDRRPGPLCGQ